MLDPTSMILAGTATHGHVTSARPAAPIRPDQPARRQRTDAGRVLIATMLRRLASRVEPRAVRPCRPA